MNRREFSTGILKSAAMLSFGAGFSSIVRAEGRGGAVVGNYYFGDGQAADNAVVLVKDETGESRLVRADAAGNFRFDGVAQGGYSVVAIPNNGSATAVSRVNIVSEENVSPEFPEKFPYLICINRASGEFLPFSIYEMDRWSDVVVIGRVLETRVVRKPDDVCLDDPFPFDSEVDVEVETSIKGNGRLQRITVRADTDQGKGRMFQPGNFLLLHLKNEKKIESEDSRNRLYQAYPDFVERKLTPESKRAYVACYQRIARREKLPVNDGYPSVEELVRDAEALVSQWDATAQLVAMRKKVRSDWELTPDQKNRLTNLLFSKKTIGYRDVPLVELVGHFKEPRFFPFLIRNGLSFDGNPRKWTAFVVRLIPKFHPDETLRQLVRAYVKVGGQSPSYDPLTQAPDAEVERFDFEAGTFSGLQNRFFGERNLLIKAIRRTVKDLERG